MSRQHDSMIHPQIETLLERESLEGSKFALVTLAMGWLAATGLHIDAGFTKQLPLKHEYMRTFLKHEEAFGGANRVLVALIAALFLIHAGRAWLLTQDDDVEFLLWFAFIPARYDTSLLQGISPGDVIPGGIGPQVWTFLTYAFLHADWTHV